MKKAPIFLGLGFVLIVAALILWPIVRVRHLENRFGEITGSDTKNLVVERMGAPWKDEDCGKYLGGQPPGCAEEFTYAHPYAPYVPEYWVIDFNSSHRVIGHVHLISP